MARQQRFDWYLSKQRKRMRGVNKARSTIRQRRRIPQIELLESKELLSVNCGQLDTFGPVSSEVASSGFVETAASSSVAHDHNGDGIPDHTANSHDSGCCCEQCTGAQLSTKNADAAGDLSSFHDPGCCCEQCLGMQSVTSTLDPLGNSDANHDPGCCCEQCLGAQDSSSHNHSHHHGHGHPDGFWASEAEYVQATGGLEPEAFDARTPWDDQDPNVDGIQISYSYSNFLDGNLPGGLTPDELRAATEEALGLWASVAPLFFIEVVDSGPDPENPPDGSYPAADHPILRIGHHLIDGPSSVLAHAYFPQGGGLGGDVHFDNGDRWNINPAEPGFDVIEVMTHELGHALGLGHEFTLDAIMNPFYGGRFEGPGTGFLLDDDIAGIQELYGASEEGGGVDPLPQLEVNTLLDGDDTEFVTDPDTMETMLVDNTPDILTLREALKLGSDANSGRDVTFAEDLFPSFDATYSISLDENLGPLTISGTLNLIGPGASLVQNPDLLTIVASDSSPVSGDGMQILLVDNEDPLGLIPDTVAEVSISGLSFTGADAAVAGGAIGSTENLTLSNVHIYDNHSEVAGGGIHSTGLLSISNSTLDGNSAANDGGAILTSGGVHIDNSTLNGNDAGDEGGAIAAEGQNTEVIVTSSTLSGNTATGNGGAIHNLDDNPKKFRVLHSTIYQNTSGGSGGGIYMLDGVLALEHSIVAGNSDTAGAPDLDNINLFDQPVILTRYSLIENANGSQLTQQDPNVIGVSPLLAPLADNGGSTQTHEPMDGSPVLNAGNPTIPVSPEFDQRGRGFTRIFEGVIDIGAVESGGFEQLYTVNSLRDVNDLDAFGIDQTPEELTLREAIAISNDQLGKNLINFDSSLNGGIIDISASLGEFLVSDGTTIDATDLSAGLTINAATADQTPTTNDGNGVRAFRADDGNVSTFVDIELRGLTITGGDVTGHGGAIHSLENLSLYQVTVSDSYASGNGGGVYHKAGATGGTLLIDSSTISNNEATLDGGGLWSDTNLPAEPDPEPNPIVGIIVNSTVSNNLAGDEGGGIMTFDGQLEIRHSTITENEAAHGSGVVSFGDELTRTLVYSSIIAGNVVNINDPADLNDDTGFDVQRSRNIAFNSFVSLGYNLIGDGSGLANFNNNDEIEVEDPKLRPLGNYGGKTQTHALLPDSPAVDAGDPNAVLPSDTAMEPDVVVSEFDQRGDGFSRILDGNDDGDARLDIGSFELPTPEPDADFDNDNDVDGTDFLTWQRGFGMSNPSSSDGDTDADGDVDSDDLLNWKTAYGDITPALERAPEQPASDRKNVRKPMPVVGRSAYREVATNTSVASNALSAAAQVYLLRETSPPNDSDVSESANKNSDFADSASEIASHDSQLSEHRRPQGEVATFAHSEDDRNGTLDRVFESIGQEQPLRFPEL